MLRGPVVLITISLALNACRLTSCPPPVFSNSNVAWETVVGAPTRIHGRVLTIDKSMPIASSRVRLIAADSTWHSVNADGSFSIASAGPGAIVLEVAAVGFEQTSARVVIPADSSASVLAVLQRSSAVVARAACGERGVVR